MPGAVGDLSDPEITVVIPVKDGASTLEGCLRSIWVDARAAGLSEERIEIVVANNGSSDGSPDIAAGLGCRLVHVPAEKGVSAARNAGARAARGEILVFTDSDVCFCEGAISAIRAAFAQPETDGIVGIQDPAADYPNFPSRFKNLWMAYSYLRQRGPVPLFYTTAAAIRRNLFLTVGGFDERYRRPDVEDTEFGQRLGAVGARVEIRPGFRVRHLKTYSLGSLLKTDFRRSASLARLLLRRRGEGQARARANTTSVPTPIMAGVLVGAATLIVAALALMADRTGWAVTGLFLGLALCLALHGGFLDFIRRQAGAARAAQGAGIVLLDLGWIASGVVWGLAGYLLLGRRY